MSLQAETTTQGRLRRAQPKDVSRMARVFVESQGARGTAASRTSVTLSAVERWMHKAVIHDEAWVIEREFGELAGVMALSGADLYALDVTPSARNRGFGRMLLDKAKSRRPGGLRARVVAGQHDAQSFLLHNGFSADSSSATPELHWRAGAPLRDHRPFRIVTAAPGRTPHLVGLAATG